MCASREKSAGRRTGARQAAGGALQGGIPQFHRDKPASRGGFHDLANLIGEFDAWKTAGVPVTVARSATA